MGHVCHLTCDFEEAAKYYRKTIDSGDHESLAEIDEAKKKLCQIHYQMGSYEDCIDTGLAKCPTVPFLREYVAKSYFQIAKRKKGSAFSDYKQMVGKSAELGLLEAGREFLFLTEKECSNNKDLSLTQTFYEDMSRLHGWFSSESGLYWSIEDVNIPECHKTIARDAHKLVLAQPGVSHMAQIHREKLLKTRELRFEMACEKVCFSQI